MIEKLRKKFIITALISVFALLTAILLVINFVNFSMVSDQADRILEQLATEGGAFREMDGQPQMGAPQDRQDMRPMGPNSPELRNTTRYFTVDFDQEGNVMRVDLHMNAVNEAQATEWAAKLLGKKGGWTNTYYRYKVWTNDAGTHITVIDQGRELSPSYRVLIASCIGVAVGMLITLFVLLGISKIVVSPIEQSDRRQKRFIRDAAVEIKNPIMTIDANRHLLVQREGDTEETKSIEHEVKHLTKVVQGLDSLLLLEESDMSRGFNHVDLSALVREICAAYRQNFESEGKKLTIDVEDGVTMSGDPKQLGELMNICLDNALMYSKSQATVSLKRNGERKSIVVQNDAHIAEEGPMDSVFERFYRSEEVRESGIDGAGLQLSIAKEIVSKHGGRILAEGKKGLFELKIEL